MKRYKKNNRKRKPNVEKVIKILTKANEREETGKKPEDVGYIWNRKCSMTYDFFFVSLFYSIFFLYMDGWKHRF